MSGIFAIVVSSLERVTDLDTFDKSKTVKDTDTGLYNVRETAKALGVTILVKTIDGVDYVVLKNYDKWSQSLLHGGVFKADNA